MFVGDAVVHLSFPGKATESFLTIARQERVIENSCSPSSTMPEQDQAMAMTRIDGLTKRCAVVGHLFARRHRTASGDET